MVSDFLDEHNGFLVLTVSKLKADNMRAILVATDNFKYEKSLGEHYLAHKGCIHAFVPKFHPELNTIERV